MWTSSVVLATNINLKAECPHPQVMIFFLKKFK